jgi:hypothetical protein
MTDPITDQTAYLLAIDDAAFVPLDFLYEELMGQGLVSEVNFDLYRWLLEVDERFEVFEGLGEMLFGEIEEWVQPQVLAFLSGPWVHLLGRPFTMDDLIRDLLHYLVRMNETLEITWQFLPDEPEAAEAKEDLLNMLMWGDMLERRLRATLSSVPEEPPEPSAPQRLEESNER